MILKFKLICNRKYLIIIFKLRGINMEMKYVIGVDGGNTKTDYFLFDTAGNFISHRRDGTCSHEKLPDGYEGAYRIMEQNILDLLEEQDLMLEDVAAGVFGLAGLDVPEQKEQLEAVIRKIGLKKFVADNDGYLGLKAGLQKGYGVCSINGTGTVTTGIDESGQRLQVGGVGYISGDDAGGAFLTRKLFRKVYDALYRCEEETTLIKPVLSLLEVTDKKYFIQRITKLYKESFSHTPFIREVFEQATMGDAIASKILKEMAIELARSTAGCIENLDFNPNETVEVVLAGSVWVKPKESILLDFYKEEMAKLTDYVCSYTILQIPPGIGAILWALELAQDKPVEEDLRNQIIQAMTKLYAD